MEDFKWYETYCTKYLNGNCQFGNKDDECTVCCMDCERQCAERCQEGFDE